MASYSTLGDALQGHAAAAGQIAKHEVHPLLQSEQPAAQVQRSKKGELQHNHQSPSELLHSCGV